MGYRVRMWLFWRILSYVKLKAWKHSMYECVIGIEYRDCHVVLEKNLSMSLKNVLS